jgi:curved DNA-binding protein
MDMADLLAAMGKGAHGPRPVKGRDYENTVQITLEDARRGSSLSLDVATPNGRSTLNVTVPPGVREGQKLRLKGNGGADGDIYLHISLKPHPVFRTDRHDLYFDLALAPWEAALGGDIEVPTLEGNVLLTVPAGTRSGRKLRLRGRGLASGSSDLYAIVHIDVPATLTEHELALYEDMARTSHFNPRATTPQEKSHASNPS